MKFLFSTLFVTLFFNQLCFAQNYKAEYLQVINFGDKPDTTSATLVFNNRQSVYSFGRQEGEQMTNSKVLSDDNSTDFYMKLRAPKGFVYFADFKDKIFTNREMLFTKPVIVVDSMVAINWKIDASAEKKVDKLNCKKAIGDFRGRTYEVWFTEDIPTNAGPWKLWGLPGLIVEVKDTKTDVISVKLITIKPTIESLEKPTEQEILTQTQFVSLFKKKMANLAKFISTGGPRKEGFETSTKIKMSNVLETSLYNN